jgi:hypothetical protein
MSYESMELKITPDVEIQLIRKAKRLFVNAMKNISLVLYMYLEINTIMFEILIDRVRNN